jgi:hypothetical protein
MRFGNEALFRQSQTIEGGRIVLAKCYINMICGGELGDGLPKKGTVTLRAKTPAAITPSAAVEVSL